MIGWAIPAALAALTSGGLWWATRRRALLEPIAAALLLACAGYAWQGRPGLPGSPTRPRANEPPFVTGFAAERKVWLEQVGHDAEVLDAADNMIARGDAAYGLGIVRAAMLQAPDDSTLWLGVGNAMVAYADGVVTPPARYAFDRAAALAPANPAPAYFLGLACAQMGDLDGAEKIWRELLATHGGAGAWRLRVAQKLAILAALQGRIN